MLYCLRKQATITNNIKLSGIGVHSGKLVSLEICPAPENFGIVFERIDIQNSDNFIKAEFENVVEPVLCTRLINKSGASVSVVEHLVAALRIAGISNALIKINEEEVPIMDGSAKLFLDAIYEVGVFKQKSEVPALIIKSPINLSSEHSSISAAPSFHQSFQVFLNYKRINPVIKSNNISKFSLNNKSKTLDIAQSRTFGWLEDSEKIRNLGMAKGASLENTVIINEKNTIINQGGLRNKNEIVNHKALDLIGDFSLIGTDLVADIRGVNTSHLQNNLFLKKLMKEKHMHTIVSTSEELDYCAANIDELRFKNMQII